MLSLYDPQRVKRLFDEMARTYGLVNVISSFGFCRRWRRRCLRSIKIPVGGRALDLMSGMGELCPDLSRILGPSGQIAAHDFSSMMCRAAAGKRFDCDVQIIEADVLTHSFEPGHADVVVSSFGLKTFSGEQIAMLARTVAGALRPGGVFSFVEIFVPPGRWLRGPYMVYINHIILLIGALFLGNPDNYRQLGIYTGAFGNGEATCRAFRDAGLEVQQHSMFFGCATGITGRRPPGK